MPLSYSDNNIYLVVGDFVTIDASGYNIHTTEITGNSELPSGLSVDTEGNIGGTVTAPFNSNPITIYYNDGGPTNNATLNIYVIELSYETVYYSPGQPLGFLADITGDGFVPSNYSISPDLPDGLTFSSSNGLIDGIPTEISETTSYDITFKDPENNNHTFNVTVIGYSVTYENMMLYVDEPFIYTPIIVGPSPTYFHIDVDISPSFISGINIDNDTGIISGTPPSAIETTEYIISYTIGSYGGRSTFTMTIENTECLLGTSNILTPHGYKQISSLSNSEYVVSDNKTIKKIKNVHKTTHFGKLYVITKQSLGVYPLNNIYLSGNHKFQYRNKWYSPKKYLPSVKINEPVDLYHIELHDQTENIIVDGIVMESHHPANK